MRRKLVDLEPYEIRLILELLYKYRNSLRGEWDAGTIAILINTFARAYGMKAFTEEYPEIEKYLIKELGE